MNIKEIYEYALDQLLAVALQVKDDDFDKPTPDTEWNVQDLMKHIMTELVWLADMVEGRTVSEVGDVHAGDLLGNDPISNMRLAIESAEQTVQEADLSATAHLSYADKPVGTYLLESADDILIHAWDLGQAIGVSVVFDELVAQTLLDHMQSMVDGSGNSLFAKHITTEANANTQTKLLALLGRSENWAERR